MKLFRNKKGSQLVEKIMMTAFSVAAGAAVIVYGAGVITQSKAVSPDVANNVLDGTPGTQLGSFVLNGTAYSTATLHGTVSGEGENLTVTNVKIRFGAKIQQSDWQAIKDKWTITNYGAFLVRENTLLNTYGLSSVEEAYYAGKNLTDKNKGSGEDPYLENNYYIFTIAINMTDASRYGDVLCGAPYIASSNNEILFFPEVRGSVKTLAQKALAENDYQYLSAEALTYLTNC